MFGAAGTLLNVSTRAQNQGKPARYNIDNWDEMMMRRDKQLTGHRRGQSDNPIAPAGYETTRLGVLNRRAYTTPNAQHAIYISNSTNPYFNLTFEDWLFRHKAPAEPLLLIYRDHPCVVIGRNQNPWKEVNFEAMRTRPGIPFIRRRSGGGTVYHDLGNTNFSIHLPREEFDRHATAHVVLRAVRSLGIDARVNDRNDICVGLDKMSVQPHSSALVGLSFCQYVSGSAYKIVNKRAYHHGTMLLSSRLDTLGDLLRPTKDSMITRGVASVRSPVCNLQQYSREITHDTFTNAVVDSFRQEYGVTSSAQYIDETDELKNVEYIRNGMLELPSWDWAYGQTPEFTYTLGHDFAWGSVAAEIRSKHGIINACNLTISNALLDDSAVEHLTNLGRILEGKQYGFLGDLRVAQEQAGPRRDILRWIKEEIET
ncbi:hypothetical protein DXG03_006355 [Asterophora parasitica]|uniref:Putative lipoate-protein ligase A n=1 Tax=Asterophora parasitica TaxID=117018 RepID=A0A9P7G132_9AGAR|nr:hypothetical protein DXG03_006355 [Asterophora parasitica]